MVFLSTLLNANKAIAYANLQNLLALNAAEYVNNTLNPPEDETEA